MTKSKVSVDSRTLQHIAFSAVVLFGLLMAFAIHTTEGVVAELNANYFGPVETALSSGVFPGDEPATTSTSTQQ